MDMNGSSAPPTKLLNWSLNVQLYCGHENTLCLLSSSLLVHTSQCGLPLPKMVLLNLANNRSCPCRSDMTLVSVNLREFLGKRCFVFSESDDLGLLSGHDISIPIMQPLRKEIC